ncbi:MAG: hypothetical protein JWR80_8061 [Bradyrhizobium sp.]|nr:hypothetical protein [Bradyrhizobium sp.]
MMNRILKNTLAAAAASLTLMAVAAPADASVLIDSIKVKNAQGTWLQVAEVQVFSSPSVVPITGLTATATSSYSSPLNDAPKAVDGVTNGDYYNPASIYHGGASNGTDELTISFAATDVNKIQIFGRTDGGFGVRDTYTYALFYNGSQVGTTGFLDARSGSAVLALPEASTWAMMLAGFGLVGFGLRRRAKPTVRVAYA